MGVIITLLLGSFPQDNMGMLLGGQDVSTVAGNSVRMFTTISGIMLSNHPYQGSVLVLKPELGAGLGDYSISLGYLVSFGYTGGIPVTVDASYRWKAIEGLALRPRIGLIGPARFNEDDPFYKYDIPFTVGGGADAVYCPLPDAGIKPVIAFGITAGYSVGTLSQEISDHSEPIEGFGVGVKGILSIILEREKLNMALSIGSGYSPPLGTDNTSSWGKLLPEAGLSFIW